MIDPITIEVIGSALSSIVEEMGEALIRASYSTNIKERRDCSTALFDLDGKTLCQAEHIPMHLGSFLDLIPHIMKRHPLADMRPGDVFCGNDAYEGGGTHLPDIVLAEPVFVDGRDDRLGGQPCAPRRLRRSGPRPHLSGRPAHPADPPVSRRRAATGCAIADPAELPGPTRTPFRFPRPDGGEPLGVQRLQRLCAKYGRDTVLQAGAALQDYAERKMRAGIAAIPDGVYAFRRSRTTARRSTGNSIFRARSPSAAIRCILISRRRRKSAPDLNMTMTALLSTVYYAVKAIVDPTILPNAGLARPLTVTAPAGSIVDL